MKKKKCGCGKNLEINPKTGKYYALCIDCYRKRAKQNQNPNPYKRQSVISKTIDIESLYNRLKKALEKRADYQEAQNNLWKYIKRTNSNRSEEMTKISDGIGGNTHEINIILNELTQYKKTHKAMNMAYNYLQKEISRTQKIIVEWQKTVRDVEAGRNVLISSTGVNHTNTTNVRNYIQKKKNQLANLQKWQNHVSHYLE